VDTLRDGHREGLFWCAAATPVAGRRYSPPAAEKRDSEGPLAIGAIANAADGERQKYANGLRITLLWRDVEASEAHVELDERASCRRLCFTGSGIRTFGGDAGNSQNPTPSDVVT